MKKVDERRAARTRVIQGSRPIAHVTRNEKILSRVTFALG
jgi:hypothetical protein